MSIRRWKELREFMALDLQDAVAFLGLSKLKGIGFHSLRQLGDLRGLAARLDSTAGDELLKQALAEDVPSASQRRSAVMALGAKALTMLQDRAITLVARGDPEYPSSFYDLGEKSRPNWFYYRGDVRLLAGPSIAVVGTRDPSLAGDFLAKYAVSTIAELGYTVVSGLARGVDEIAHEWAIQADVKNISVLGTGLLRMYPAKNASLADRIVHAGGVLISEYAPLADPTKESFVWRNRLQAALATSVIAPQWKTSSGTAHTIRYAQQMGRRTINLQLQGTQPPPNHGVADETFQVPSEHQRLVDRLRQLSTHPEMGTAPQLNLFGING
jgi:DNA protecting protein DprA